MKKYVLTAALTMFVAGSAMAFGLPKVDAGGEKVKVTQCLTEEAKASVLDASVPKNDVQKWAETISLRCAAKIGIQSSPETIQLAVEILNKMK